MAFARRVLHQSIDDGGEHLWCQQGGGGRCGCGPREREAAPRNILFYFTFLLAHIKNKNNKLQDFEKIAELNHR
jgi:hypothetical protein